MKARQFRKLRKRIGKIQKYKVRPTCGLFGDFFGHNRLCLTFDDVEITASSPIRALEIYMRNYRKSHKQISKHQRDEYSETSEQWGTLMVTDEKEFRYFFS
jgi:hypothetical protein